MTGFVLDPRLAADTHPVGDLPLSRVLLMDDGRFPWLILVPRAAGLVEVDDLAANERAAVLEETILAGIALRAICGAEKLNIGALGNIVRQLHVHVVARRAGDPAWPGPVWGAGTPERRTPATREDLVRRLRGHFGFAGT